MPSLRHASMTSNQSHFSPQWPPTSCPDNEPHSTLSGLTPEWNCQFLLSSNAANVSTVSRFQSDFVKETFLHLKMTLNLPQPKRSLRDNGANNSCRASSHQQTHAKCPHVLPVCLVANYSYFSTMFLGRKKVQKALCPPCEELSGLAGCCSRGKNAARTIMW